MAELEEVLMRIPVDISGKKNVEDAKTLGVPTIWAGGDTILHLGVFNGAATVDLTNVASIKAQVKTFIGGKPSDPSIAVLFEDEVLAADIVSTITEADWTAESAQHATFNFTNAQTAISAATYWIFFTAILNDGKIIPLGGGPFKIVEDGVGATTVTEDTPAIVLSDGDFATQAQAEAGTDASKVMSPLRVAEAIVALGGGPTLIADFDALHALTGLTGGERFRLTDEGGAVMRYAPHGITWNAPDIVSGDSSLSSFVVVGDAIIDGKAVAGVYDVLDVAQYDIPIYQHRDNGIKFESDSLGYAWFISGAGYAENNAAGSYPWLLPVGNFIDFESGSITSITELPQEAIPSNWVNESAGNLISLPIDFFKTLLTDLPVGQLVDVINEANRLERFLGGDASNQANWQVLRNTIYLTFADLIGGGPIVVNGVTVPLEATQGIGWVSVGEEIATDYSDGIEWLSFVVGGSIANKTIVDPAFKLSGNFVFPDIFPPRALVTIEYL